jgi:3-oxoadipate enol-lactonase
MSTRTWTSRPETVEIDDIALHVEVTGSGPAMLFVHGMCGDADVWAGQAQRFSDSYPCVQYDRRGHSRSGRGHSAIDVHRHADDAAALIEALGLAPCLLVGSSAGAVIAVDVALRHGPLLRGAVFSEPPLVCLDPDARHALADILMPIVRRAADGDKSAAVDAFFTAICPGLWASLDEDGRDRYRANAGIGFTDVRSPSLDVTPLDLAVVRIPCLVLTGTASLPALRSVAHRLAAALPNARLIDIPGSGHVTYAERPEEFFEAVRVFAAELDRRPGLATLTGGVPCDR